MWYGKFISLDLKKKNNLKLINNMRDQPQCTL